jgi:CHAD domain-containing protein
MPYRLGDGEGADHAIRRCAGEQLDRAIAELSDGVKTDPVDAVHAARKALKKERSLLRLARGSLSSSVRRRENTALRDAGRRLSEARDADVLVQAVDDLAERYAGQLPERAFAAVRKQLQAGGEGARGSVIDGGLTSEVAEELKAIRLRVGNWRLRRSGWKAVDDGLVRSYQRGRKAFRRARTEPSVERMHEWRKRAKDHWYHLRLLEPISQRTMRGQAKDAHLLSDLLGDDRDLALLRQSLIATGASLPVDVDSVIALIDRRRGQLQTDAVFLGERVYAEKPKAFRRRLRRYWKAWQAQTREAESQHPAQLAQRTRHATVA